MFNFEKEREKWLDDPLRCTYSLFLPHGERLYPRQEEIVASACLNDVTLVSSHHAAGKTHTAALTLLTFLFMYIDSKVITTAPGWSQVKFLLWAEVKNIWNNSPLVKALEYSEMPISEFGMMDIQLKLDEEWFAIGVSPKQDAGEDVNKRFTGYHAKKMLAILDEGPAVSPSIWNAIDTLLTSHGSHLLAIGNPVESTGPFFKGFLNPDYSRIKLDIFQSPNFATNGINDIKTLKKLAALPKEELTEKLESFSYPYPAIVSPAWAIKMLKKWGETSPLFISRVLSEFPGKAKDSIISLADLEACKNENIDNQDFKRVLSCDPARFGDDETVIMGTKNGKECLREKKQGKDLMYTSSRLIHLQQENKYNVIVVDETGIGAGVVDRLREFYSGRCDSPIILGVNFGGKPTGKYQDTCANIVTQLFKELEELLKDKKIGLNDEGNLFLELTGRKYDFKNGKMIVEAKSDYKKRTGQGSPDEGDALLLNVYGLLHSENKCDFSFGEDRESVSADW